MKKLIAAFIWIALFLVIASHIPALLGVAVILYAIFSMIVVTGALFIEARIRVDRWFQKTFVRVVEVPAPAQKSKVSSIPLPILGSHVTQAERDSLESRIRDTLGES